MANIAIIKNGTVENLIEVTGETRASIRAHFEALGYICVNDAAAGPGYTWDGSAFSSAPAQTSRVTTMSTLDFLSRFTPAERASIRAAAQSIPLVDDFLFLLQMAGGVDVTDSRTTTGVTALEAGGLLAAGRAAEILA